MDEIPRNVDDVIAINKDREERGIPGRWVIYDISMNDDVEFEYFFNPAKD